MNLKITNCNNYFKVKGILDKESVSLFNSEFENIFERTNAITISVQYVESMDKYGVNAIAKLYEEATRKNKSLSIVGYGCKELYQHFNTNTAA
ncbi:hypothetical protein KFZ70_07095 [Tamlana fucoidanivorans]|uniref:STAS domain-containing protein n=1 Tax=Allotamlana fucoidanivorans TaxID=2583814 RepID=A0A5C4SMC0_9FLAO|nr:STAS domain-containing protein [Tamlana fucoidanivorans]TNJ45226.1 hypothetical protein FGF67_05820 [Tamlana fucoidanivorans]